jgi:glycosyltransferase involved in cell wall biosynthesis
MIEISIVIPCYNHGSYLIEALDSVNHLKQDFNIEVLVVNDGSTNRETIDIFEHIQGSGCKILHQPNQGLAQARNNGIRASSGHYILPLDSDNLVVEGFVKNALDVFKKMPQIDIVYSDSLHFGEKEFYNQVGDFDPCKLINDNYIDACAIYKRKVWVQLGGYDGKMPAMGHEDWDFWIMALMKNMQFHYLPIPGFKYRIRPDSMLRNVTIKRSEENREYIYNKHNYQLFKSIRKNYNPTPENYKLFYLNLLSDLKNNRIKNIAKLLLGKQFS